MPSFHLWCISFCKDGRLSSFSSPFVWTNPARNAWLLERQKWLSPTRHCSLNSQRFRLRGSEQDLLKSKCSISSSQKICQRPVIHETHIRSEQDHVKKGSKATEKPYVVSENRKEPHSQSEHFISESPVDFNSRTQRFQSRLLNAISDFYKLKSWPKMITSVSAQFLQDITEEQMVSNIIPGIPTAIQQLLGAINPPSWDEILNHRAKVEFAETKEDTRAGVYFVVNWPEASGEQDLPMLFVGMGENMNKRLWRYQVCSSSCHFPKFVYRLARGRNSTKTWDPIVLFRLSENQRREILWITRWCFRQMIGTWVDVNNEERKAWLISRVWKYRQAPSFGSAQFLSFIPCNC